jgi:hypothetical protein
MAASLAKQHRPGLAPAGDYGGGRNLGPWLHGSNDANRVGVGHERDLTSPARGFAPPTVLMGASRDLGDSHESDMIARGRRCVGQGGWRLNDGAYYGTFAMAPRDGAARQRLLMEGLLDAPEPDRSPGACR